MYEMYDMRIFFLTKNQLFSLFVAAFSKLTRLKKLNLDSNNITEIKAFAFKGLKDLIEISVQNNPIKTLSSFAFAGNILKLFMKN